MKKRILSILTALALCLSLMAVPALAYTVSFSNSAGLGTMEPVHDVSGDYTLPESGFTYWNEEKQFKGWEINGELYDPGDVYSVSADTVVKAVWEFIGGEVTVYFDNSLAGWDYVSVYYELDNGEQKLLGDLAAGNGASQAEIVCVLPANAVSVCFTNYPIGQPEDTVPGGYQTSEWMDVVDGAIYRHTPEPEPELWVGSVKVTEANAADVLGDGTVSYDKENNLLTLNETDLVYEGSGDGAIRTDGDLNIKVVGMVLVEDQPAVGEDFSAAIAVEGALSITGDEGILHLYGGDVNEPGTTVESYGISVGGGLQVYGVEVNACAGSATADGEHTAYSNGVYCRGSVDLDYGGILSALGGTAEGYEAYSSGMDVYGSEDEYVNLAVYDGTLLATGGDATGILYGESSGAYLYSGGLYVYQSEALVVLNGGEAEATCTVVEENPYAASNGIYVYAGDVGIDGGTVDITAGSWSGLNGDGCAVYVRALEDEDGSMSGGYLDIGCDDAAISKYGPWLEGLRVTLSAAEGDAAVYARMGIDLDDTVTLSAPEDGKVAGQGEVDAWYMWDYYTVVDDADEPAQIVVMEPLGYTVTITGLSYGRRALVPAGMSLNEAYCDLLEIDDFSEALDTEKDGYSFVGWYTDPDFARDSKFSFDDAVEGDVTIYPKWEKYEPITQVTVIKHNEDGSVTTTVNDLVNDVLKRTTEYPDGTTVAVVTDQSGGVSVEATLPEGMQEFTVTVPYETWTAGTVALLVDENGVKRLLTGTVVDEEKQTVTLTLTGSGKVEIVNNDKAFDDVSSDDWFTDAVNYVTAGGLLDGVSETSFDPEGTANRALLVTALWRLEGAPVVNYLLPFSDVEQDAWYAEAVRWAAGVGLVNGFPDGTFRPDGVLTRQEMATFLYRYEQYCGGGFTGMWMFLLDCTDREQVAEWAYEPLCWMTMKRVMQGDGSGALKPQNAATRAEMAQIIMNYLEQENG